MYADLTESHTLFQVYTDLALILHRSQAFSKLTRALFKVYNKATRFSKFTMVLHLHVRGSYRKPHAFPSLSGLLVELWALDLNKKHSSFDNPRNQQRTSKRTNRQHSHGFNHSNISNQEGATTRTTRKTTTKPMNNRRRQSQILLDLHVC